MGLARLGAALALPSIPTPYVWAGLFLAGVAAGGYATHTWHKAQRVDALERAQKAERGLQRDANQADVRYVERALERQAAAESNAKAFQGALHARNEELARCRVDAELLGLLDGRRVPAAAGDPAQPRPPGARAAPPPAAGNAARELETCRANYRDVCEPNALQLDELRTFCGGMIRKYNQSIGKD